MGDLSCLAQVRQAMRDKGIQGGLWVPHGDVHHNEYVPACYQRLKWLTNFSGSAGLALVTQQWAVLFVDGRYTLQAPTEVDTHQWTVGSLQTSAIQKWILDHRADCPTIAYDPWLISVTEAERWLAWGCQQAISFEPTTNIIDDIWTDRPPAPLDPIYTYPLEYAGEDSLSKRQRLSQRLQEKKLDWAFFAQPESIAWLLNLRGHDVPTTPIFLSFAALDREGHLHVWVHENKIPPVVADTLKKVTLHPYDVDLIAKVFSTGCRVTLDPDTTPVALKDILVTKDVRISLEQDLTLLPKALKNPTEQKAMIQAHEQDGLALIRCLAWLKGGITELDVVRELHAFRCQSPLFKGDSFDTIAATGPHGAIVHYKPKLSSQRTLQKGDLFLLDSGGQYWGGTTDVTRTLFLGASTLEQRQAFTRVLKGHIRLAQARFPQGTTGSQLDSLARFDLWQAGQDYAHGTGHGVGSYLSVHEGPQRISSYPSSQSLEEGMVLSNEPGYYVADAFGIRIESLVMVKPSSYEGFLEFDTITLVPIDNRLVEKSMLTSCELTWLRAYHERICATLLPLDPSLHSYLQASFFVF